MSQPVGFTIPSLLFNHTTDTITMDRAKGLGSVKETIAVDSIDAGDAQRNDDLLALAFFDAAMAYAISAWDNMPPLCRIGARANFNIVVGAPSLKPS